MLLKFKVRLSLLQWKLIDFPDKVYLFIAHRLPKRLRYWSAIDSAARATTGQYSNQIPGDLKYFDMLERI